MKVHIETGEQARKLVVLACKREYADYDIDCSHGRYIIDMKSIMGMLSLAWPNDVEIKIHADQDVQDRFYKDVSDIIENK